MQIQDEGEKTFGQQKKRKAVESAKTGEAKHAQAKRGRQAKTPAKTAPRSATKPAPKSSASMRYQANMSSRVSTNDWNDDRGVAMRVDEEEPYNYDDQFNISFPEPPHPLYDPELLPVHPLPPPITTLPPPPPLEFETGSKGSREREETKRAVVSTRKRLSESSVLRETIKPPLHPSRAANLSEKEKAFNLPGDQRAVSSKVGKESG
ncbi:hypothetical protein EON65_40745 [archaeon]|nr:MAG: hypothetical protein EON65_40745 [archaeon]